MKFYSLPTIMGEYELSPLNIPVKKLKEDIVKYLESGALQIPYFSDSIEIVIYSTRKRTYDDNGEFNVYDENKLYHWIGALPESCLKKEATLTCKIKKVYQWE